MRQVTLGSTGITVPKNGFGALPIQRVDFEEAKRIFTRAYEGGIRYFDSAHGYTDSEEKIGYALADVRKDIYIATKSPARTGDVFKEQLQLSLERMKTDYIDVMQFHNLPFCPKPGDGTGLYEAMAEAKKKGYVKHIGITNHRQHVAMEAIESGLFETIQFPFSYLASEEDLNIMNAAKAHNMGFIAMKGLSGGLLTHSDLCYAWMAQYESVIPIWGIQRMSELEEFLSYQDNEPELTAERLEAIAKDRVELAGNFCRGCGYCMPCPVGIEINTAARMAQLIRRSPSAKFFTEEGQARMMKIEDCIGCYSCASKCPYGLDTPKLLKENLADYKKFLSGEYARS
ncbi:MAG: aldo/keto reductase [Lachnospiraceae bacterium]|nr:aldo/keto reductase [Lachnospiraceae bacterium]